MMAEPLPQALWVLSVQTGSPVLCAQGPASRLTPGTSARAETAGTAAAGRGARLAGHHQSRGRRTHLTQHSQGPMRARGKPQTANSSLAKTHRSSRRMCPAPVVWLYSCDGLSSVGGGRGGGNKRQPSAVWTASSKATTLLRARLANAQDDNKG